MKRIINPVRLGGFVFACVLSATMPVDAAKEAPKVIDLKTLPGIESMIPDLVARRVVFVGETHTRYDHHLNQLEIIRRLHARDARLAIGVEFFQQPFQRYLDDYIAGKIGERELLTKTEYYARWHFDFRLYAPILAFAREHKIPVIALNVPSEITRKIGREGLAALTPEERAWVPDMAEPDVAYRERLRAVFAEHPQHGQSEADFDHFLAAQLIWDEGMAQRAAEYLRANPGRRLVVLAGIGHAMREGMPRALARRVPLPMAVVLNGPVEPLDPEVADYVLVSSERALPPPGVLGLMLETGNRGAEVVGFSKDSAAQAAGVKAGDQLLTVDGQRVRNLAETRATLWNKRRGETVPLELFRANAPLSLSVTLR